MFANLLAVGSREDIRGEIDRYHALLDSFSTSSPRPKSLVEDEVVVLERLGLLYFKIQRFQTAEKFLFRARDTLEEIYPDLPTNAPRNLLGLYGEIQGNIGLLYMENRRPWEALDFFQQALDIHAQCGDQRGQAYILETMGQVFFRFRQFYNAVLYLQQALRLFKELGDESHGQEIQDQLDFIYQK